MRKKLTLVVGVAALTGMGLSAQAGHGHHRGRSSRNRISDRTILRLAESDGTRGISADEWESFKDGLGADADGVVDVDSIADLLSAESTRCRGGDSEVDTDALTGLLDRDDDGTVTLDDLDAIYEGADCRSGDDSATDGATGDDTTTDDGDSSAGGDSTAGGEDTTTGSGDTTTDGGDTTGGGDTTTGGGEDTTKPTDPELPTLPGDDPLPPPVVDEPGDLAAGHDGLATTGASAQDPADDEIRMSRRAWKGARLLLGLADSDVSGDVSGDEWTAFQGELTADEDGAFFVEDLIALLPVDGDTERELDAEKLAEKLTRALDVDRDDVLTLADLDAIFGHADRDDDGAVATDELRRRRRRRHRG